MPITADAIPDCTSAPAPVMINLGSGLQHAPGWINCDRSRSARAAQSRVLRRCVGLTSRAGLVSRPQMLAWPRETRVHDLRKGIPHATGSFDVVYSSHFLEHLLPHTARFVIDESARVLEPGGVIRIVVPDLARPARAYVEGDLAYFRAGGESLADAFMIALGLQRARPRHLRQSLLERAARRVLRTYEGGHRWIYDAQSMRQRPRRQDSKRSKTSRFGQGACITSALLDNQPRSSVHLEGVKAG